MARELPICDTHVHLWSDDDLPPWLAGDAALAPITNAHDIARYTSEAGSRVTSAVYLEVDVAPENRRNEAEWITSLCADPTNILKGAVIGAPVVDGPVAAFEEWASEWAKNKYVKGVRQVLHVQPSGTLLRDDVVEKARLCGEKGLVFELCMRCDELADVAAFAAKVPGTRIVVDHIGGHHMLVGASEVCATTCMPRLQLLMSVRLSAKRHGYV